MNCRSYPPNITDFYRSLPLSIAMERGSGGEVRYPHHTAHPFTTTEPVMNGWIAQW
jgi:hypothetical protein